jgi:hypothetical protein
MPFCRSWMAMTGCDCARQNRRSVPQLTSASGSVSFFSKPESLHNSAAHVSFSVQHHIEAGAFDAMMPRKSNLISLPLNRGSQQHDLRRNCINDAARPFVPD